MPEARLFSQSARAYIDVVSRIRPDQWDAPGLGVWNVRGLVGHTARAILTVENYLEADEPGAISVPDAETYYTTVFEQFTDNEAVAARGVEAGAWLGDNPVLTLREALERTENLIAEQPPRRIVSLGGNGMLLEQYLRTRVFELVVHTLDICEATGIEHSLPDAAISDTAALATRIAVARGFGREMLFALTGRAPLPEGFSVV
ncbi:maleylpyruvate isomerase family mycothiol-dependent enzyme [Ruicaihuangia caeni]|uniref:Maleylpyruvate isomerase N-terminal domain-containing protein n=1 Tax=Ruicaihuangia caeni TaxID=3042517 RepID=A0AAW6T4J8_9MICO|nr:maleylpyruvate isomerase family mycothiol-dependent enzyme [Klugiella sp. YN-L-19]MDI2098384.1 maleylpyruvate isomerase N-terminal domain-containing protein [Klugiella sp. YN-L-19]